MDIYSVRQQLKMRSIYDIPLRVTYYARVSSDSDEQLNSLDNQVHYYDELIKRNKAWSFVPGYIDEGLSGISTKKRENFNRMIDDASHDLFDLIITKEISRFARNTLDSIQFTRMLLYSGVGVFFQNDNINTLDEDAELRLSIMSSIAQDELRKLSSRVKFGHQQAIKSGVVLGNSLIFGYQKNDGKLVIDPDEAKMVRELFELYATGEYSMKQIETIFWNKGYRNSRGNRLSHTTMSNMLANPKYKGYYAGNKVKIIDMFSKKQKFLPQTEWVVFKDESGEIVPSIVSEELWTKANAILQKRSADVKNRQGICNHPNLLTGKMYCAHCGAPFYRKDSKDRLGNINNKWVCSGKIKNGRDSCPTFHVYEEEIKPVLLDVFRECSADMESYIDEYISMFNSLTHSQETSRKISALEQTIAMAEKKKQKLLMFNTMGQLSDSDFISMNKQCSKEIDEATSELNELRSQQMSTAELKKHLDHLRSVLKEVSNDAAVGVINKGFIDEFVDRIDCTMDEHGCMQLKIKLLTGETTQRYLESLRSRTGQTSKKMIEAYEQGLQ